MDKNEKKQMQQLKEEKRAMAALQKEEVDLILEKCLSETEYYFTNGNTCLLNEMVRLLN